MRAPGGSENIVVFGRFLVIAGQATLFLQKRLPFERPGRVKKYSSFWLFSGDSGASNAASTKALAV